MTASILYQTPLLIIAGSVFILILVFHLLGVKLSNRQAQKNPEAKADGLGPLEGALLGLLSLLLSFTFSMSANRYDTRRASIVKEANAIGTAVLRTNLYPDSIHKEFRKDLQQYLETRIDYYLSGTDETKINEALKKAEAISTRVWERAAQFSHNSENFIISNQMIPALNDMIDAVTSRDAALKAHVPYSILWLLIILTLLGSFIIGYSKKQKKNDWIILTIYALMTVITIYTIIDLDSSRSGIIKTDSTHEKMIELRNLFTEH